MSDKSYTLEDVDDYITDDYAWKAVATLFYVLGQGDMSVSEAVDRLDKISPYNNFSEWYRGKQ